MGPRAIQTAPLPTRLSRNNTGGHIGLNPCRPVSSRRPDEPARCPARLKASLQIQSPEARLGHRYEWRTQCCRRQVVDAVHVALIEDVVSVDAYFVAIISAMPVETHVRAILATTSIKCRGDRCRSLGGRFAVFAVLSAIGVNRNNFWHGSNQTCDGSAESQSKINY